MGRSSHIGSADSQSQASANTSIQQLNPAAAPVDLDDFSSRKQYHEEPNTYSDRTEVTPEPQALQQQKGHKKRRITASPSSMKASTQFNPDSRSHFAASQPQAGRSEVGGRVGDIDGFQQYGGQQDWRSHDYTNTDYRYL